MCVGFTAITYLTYILQSREKKGSDESFWNEVNMKILEFSDTHGYEGDILRILYKESGVDLLIHCGDVEGGQWKIREMAGCPCWFVKGNNDIFSDLPNELVINIGNLKAFVTHGHLYGIHTTKARVEAQARKHGAQIAMFGHTHYPYLEQKPDLTLLNPGSLTYPRQTGHQGSYLLMEIDEQESVQYTIKYLEL